MRAGRTSNARLDLVEEMNVLRQRAAKGDLAAREQLSTAVNAGRLVCGWENGDYSNVVTQPAVAA